jgi:hypothetical protein
MLKTIFATSLILAIALILTAKPGLIYVTLIWLIPLTILIWHNILINDNKPSATEQVFVKLFSQFDPVWGNQNHKRRQK